MPDMSSPSLRWLASAIRWLAVATLVSIPVMLIAGIVTRKECIEAPTPCPPPPPLFPDWALLATLVALFIGVSLLLVARLISPAKSFWETYARQ